MDEKTKTPPQTGDEKEVTIGPFSRNRIRAYCEENGDTNPFHYDPEMVRRIFGRVRKIPEDKVVVPGMQILNTLPRITIDWLGLGAAFSGISRLTIHVPALEDEEIRAVLTVVVRRPISIGCFYDLKILARVEGQPKPCVTSEFRMWVPKL